MTLVLRAPAMLVTDLDGTLLGRDGRLGERSRDALVRLGRCGVTRVVATGRSPFSFRRAVDAALPIDFAVLSSGAGIVTWPAGQTLREACLPRDQIVRGARVLRELGADFMIHYPFPDNHRFRFHRATQRNDDFERRIGLYADHAQEMSGGLDGMDRATQLLAVVPGERAEGMLASVRARLPDLSTLRTTSPLDHVSTWIEVFAAGVNKASAAAWLARRVGAGRDRVLAVGNDYNDLDLLRWAGTSRVVANAPPDLLAEFVMTASNDEDGVADAIEAWERTLV